MCHLFFVLGEELLLNLEALIEVENDVIWVGFSCMQYVLAVTQSKYVCVWDLEKILQCIFE